MSVLEQKLNELEALTRSAEFKSLPLSERKGILEDFYQRELAGQGVDRESFLESFRSTWQPQIEPLAPTERKALNLKPVWWSVGILGGTALALGALVLWTNNLQDISNIDDASLMKSLRGGNPVRLEEVALRRSLPDTGVDIWEVEKSLEQVDDLVKVQNWQGGRESTTHALEVLSRNEPAIFARVPTASRAQATAAMAELRKNIRTLQDRIVAQDVTGSNLQLRRTLWFFDLVQLAMLGDFKVEVPAEYRKLPHLAGGWVMLRFTTNQGSFTGILDGFNAPVTTGNFLDLVGRGFYNGTKITRVERFNLMQTGDPKGDGTGGFTDPATGKRRTIPLEIRPARREAEITAAAIIERRADYTQDRYSVDPLKLREEMEKLYQKYIKGDEQPIVYGRTLEKFPAIPLGPPGVLSMARYEKDPNSASSQFFVSFSDPELTPAGNNLSDGKYANFGYVTQGLRVLRKIKVGDVIEKVEVLDCKEVQFEETRDQDFAGSAIYTAKAAPNTNLETLCLPLPKPKLIQ